MERELVKASQLRCGDLVDLEADMYADPERDNPALECEFAEVMDVERETDDCVCVYFDSITVGFPASHRVWKVIT